MNHVKILGLSALLLALAIMTGAFGAHALADRLSAHYFEVWHKAVFYHFVNALGLFMIASLAPHSILKDSTIKRVSYLLLVGICLFCGSLYVLALTEMKWLGAITPFGGVSFIVGWLYLGIALLKKS